MICKFFKNEHIFSYGNNCLWNLCFLAKLCLCICRQRITFRGRKCPLTRCLSVQCISVNSPDLCEKFIFALGFLQYRSVQFHNYFHITLKIAENPQSRCIPLTTLNIYTFTYLYYTCWLEIY